MGVSFLKNCFLCLLLAGIASVQLHALPPAEAASGQHPERASVLPQRWWESASAMRTVSLKDDTEFPQLLLESAKAEAQRGEPPDTGHPKYNKLWWTIGPQVSSHVYDALAPGMPNVAAALARNLGVE